MFKERGMMLRTTLMVGFPGETDEDFNELIDFVKQTNFDRKGAFMFCPEDGKRAAEMPLYLVLLWFFDNDKSMQIWPLLVFALASLTDLLDGYIARSRNLITNFGKFMDPIADKLLTHTAFIMLTAIGRLNVTACIIFIAREFVVSGLRLCAVEQGHVIAAGMSGKIKTVLQMMLVVVLTITGEGLLPALLTIAASVMTLYSMGEYVWQNRAVLSGAK